MGGSLYFLHPLSGKVSRHTYFPSFFCRLMTGADKKHRKQIVTQQDVAANVPPGVSLMTSETTPSPTSSATVEDDIIPFDCHDDPPDDELPLFYSPDSSTSEDEDEDNGNDNKYTERADTPISVFVEETVEEEENVPSLEETECSDFKLYGIPPSFRVDVDEDKNEEDARIREEVDIAEDLGAYNDPFIIGLSLFWDVYNLSREAFGAFQQLCTLSKPDSLKRLPASLSSLHMWNEKKLPKFKLHSRRVPMDLTALPAGRPTQLDPTADMWYFNSVDLVSTLIKDPVIKSSMYFGIRQIVPKEQEFYHCRLWGESIIGVSGEYYFYKSSEDPIFPGDVVVYRGESSSQKHRTCKGGLKYRE